MTNETLDKIIIKHDRDLLAFGRQVRAGAPDHLLHQKDLSLTDGDVSIALEQYGDALMEAGKPRKASDAYETSQSMAGGTRNLERWKGLQKKIIAALEADGERIKRELGYEPSEDQDLPAFLRNRDWGYDPFPNSLL